MFNIKDILQQISPKISSEINKKKIIISIIEDILNIKIELDQIKINNKTLFINIFGVEKNELLNHKDILIQKINQKNILISDIK
ncbi:hypothetical protein H6790_00705 [Candidatus Nomurabacteria bacterium]|nr:hypothetical protein [Romboutsia sp.]MCB9820453.1 hypothetical protein [Candidatus Nomurabacteria bacterium]